MSSVMEDLKQLEDRILARIRELEANVAELEQLREVASRLGILDGAGRDTPPATIRTTATTRSRAVRGQSTGTMRAEGWRPVRHDPDRRAIDSARTCAGGGRR